MTLAPPQASGARLISVRVEDRPGVLQRVTNCLSRRGHRLLSCAVGEGSRQGELCLWLRVDTGRQPPAQAALQLAKLIDVVEVADLTEEAPSEWAVGLFDFPDPRAKGLERELERFGAQVVERSAERLLAALSGPPQLLEAARKAFTSMRLRDWVCSRPIALATTGGRHEPITQEEG